MENSHDKETKKAERLRVSVETHPGEPEPGIELLLSSARDANWTDDPGTGKAILIPDSRGNPAYEVPNPLPFAPPIGWEPTPPIEELIRDRVQTELHRLRDLDEIDDIIDAEDFDVPDELPALETIYEFIAMEKETPEIPKNSKASLEEKAKMDLDYLEALETQRLLRKRHKEAALKRQQEEHRDLYGDLDPPPAAEK